MLARKIKICLYEECWCMWLQKICWVAHLTLGKFLSIKLNLVWPTCMYMYLKFDLLCLYIVYWLLYTVYCIVCVLYTVYLSSNSPPSPLKSNKTCVYICRPPPWNSLTIQRVLCKHCHNTRAQLFWTELYCYTSKYL